MRNNPFSSSSIPSRRCWHCLLVAVTGTKIPSQACCTCRGPQSSTGHHSGNMVGPPKEEQCIQLKIGTENKCGRKLNSVEQ